MADAVEYVADLNFSILNELETALNKDGSWKKLLPHLSEELSVLDVLRMENSFGHRSVSPAMSLLWSLHITVEQLMCVLAQANLTDALEVLREDEPLLLIKDIPTSLMVVDGSKFEFRCEAVGIPRPQYQWYRESTPLDDQQTNILLIDQVTMIDQGMYSCKINKMNRKTCQLDCVHTRQCLVNVIPINFKQNDFVNCGESVVVPYICEEPSSVIVANGRECTIKCMAYGIPSPLYQWYKDGNPTDCFQEEFKIPEVKLWHKGVYKCKVWNDYGCIWSDSVTVDICLESQFLSSKYPEIVKQPNFSNSLKYGDSIVLECKVRSKYLVTYEWYKKCVLILDSNKQELKVTNDNKNKNPDNWLIQCRVSNQYGAVLSKPFILNVLPKNCTSQLSSFTAEDKVALLIANEKYENLTELDQPVDDVLKLAKTLYKKLGFKVIALADLTLVEMENATDLFCQMISSEVYAVLFYAGHGFQYQRHCFALPIDTSCNLKLEESFNLEKAVQKMQKKNPSLTMVIVDTCLNDTYHDVHDANENFESCNALSYRNTVYFFSTGWHSNSYDGVFVSHLEKHIAQNKSICDVMTDVKNEFTNDHKVSNRQMPWTTTNLSLNLSLMDRIVGTGPEFESRTDLWKKLTYPPQDRRLLFEELGLAVEIVYKRFRSVFCNALAIRFTLRSDNPEKHRGLELSDLSVSLELAEEVKLIKYTDDEVDNGGCPKTVFRIFNLQRIKNPIDGIILIFSRLSGTIASRAICFGEPMIAKANLWKNIFHTSENERESNMAATASAF